MRQIHYNDIGSNEHLNTKPPVSFPAISISIRSEIDQVKSLRNPPNLPMTYNYGRGDTFNAHPQFINAPSEDLKQLKYKDFSFFMLQNKTLDQIIQFIKLKALEMNLDERKSQKILEENFNNVDINGEDPCSSVMQLFLDKYFQKFPSQLHTQGKKQRVSRLSLSKTDGSASINQIRIKIPSQYLRTQDFQQQDNVGLMKIPLGLSSHINESHKLHRIKGLNINENQLIMCNICCEEWFYSQFFRISKQCTHLFCITCAQNYLINKIQNSDVFCIKCPQEDCNVYFYDHEIFLAINHDNYYVRKYMTIKKLKILNTNPRTRWCINIKCNNYIKTEQESALTFAYPQMKKSLDQFSECDTCKTKFCSVCCYSAHIGISCEDNYGNIYAALKKKKMAYSCDQIKHFFSNIAGFFIKLILYLFLYLLYIIICIPLSLYYPHFLFSSFKRDKDVKQNPILKVFQFLFLFILSALMYPLTFLYLITAGIKIYFLPKVKQLLDIQQNKLK